MSAAKIKKGDKVVILSGKDKGKRGEVTKSIPKDGKVIVGGINMLTRHRSPRRPTPRAGWSASKRPCTCRRLPSRTPRPASRPALASRSSKMVARSVWPRDRGAQIDG